uniref:NAC transcription factor 25 n=1 Tax=Haloxylon ammodendron TaxID=151230 RepID=A0A1B2RWF4_9CARY|nr:NAC transcription factor 25 [Haloxylon ammodendron]
MAGRSWLVDGNRIATKIKCASKTCDAGNIKWKSNPTRLCPSCHHTIDNNDVAQEWPGLPRGVKFDPTEQEIIQHLIAKSGIGDEVPHPFIDEFIPTVDEDDGICYTHPQNLPGVKQDGCASHFFHRSIKAYNTGTRKRRKIHVDDWGDVRWHKTGRTKPVMLNGVQKGCKKIMVLYVTPKGGKSEKTNWVMHQYHLGTEENEKDGNYVISKVFYQQQLQVKQSDRTADDISDVAEDIVLKADPVTPKPVTPEPLRNDRLLDPGNEVTPSCIDYGVQDHGIGFEQDHDMVFGDEGPLPGPSMLNDDYNTVPVCENYTDHQVAEHNDNQVEEHNDNEVEEVNWSQDLLNSQQLVEGISLCDDLLQSQSPNRDDVNDVMKKRSAFSDYARLGPEHLKKDLEECSDLVLDPANIDLDTPPDFRLSQLEFGSQDSYVAWGIGKVSD